MLLLHSLISILVLTLNISTLSAASDAKAILACEATAKTVSFTDTETVAAAKTLKLCLELELSGETREKLLTLKSRLNPSVRNAVFLANSCVVNVRFNEYMYSPVSGFLYSNEPKRRFFTWIPGTWDHKGKGDWKFIPSGNHFFIVATQHNEYVFAGGKRDIVDKRRKVFTWAPDFGDDVNERLGLWSLEPTGDNVYIKNKMTNEYLYSVDGMNYDSDRRSVATWSSDSGCIGDNQCIFTIKSC